MKTVRSFYDKYHMEIGNIVLILVLAIVLFPRLSADYVLHQFVIIVLLTMGLSLEMLSGVLDFAFMAEIAMTTCLGGLCLRAGFPVWVSLTVMILAQMLFGMAKGLLIGKIRVNPILLTFILQQIYQGIAAVFGDAIQAPIPRDYYGSYMFWMIFSASVTVAVSAKATSRFSQPKIHATPTTPATMDCRILLVVFFLIKNAPCIHSHKCMQGALVLIPNLFL